MVYSAGYLLKILVIYTFSITHSFVQKENGGPSSKALHKLREKRRKRGGWVISIHALSRWVDTTDPFPEASGTYGGVDGF